jgi:hypothetical protein
MPVVHAGVKRFALQLPVVRISGQLVSDADGEAVRAHCRSPSSKSSVDVASEQ